MMAEVMEPEAVQWASATAERAVIQTRMTARHVASVLGRTAKVLERSATLAEERAGRRERAGRTEAAAEQRRAAGRAHEAAARAGAQAEKWLKLFEAPET